MLLCDRSADLFNRASDDGVGVRALVFQRALAQDIY
jgi:hypothetical protein